MANGMSIAGETRAANLARGAGAGEFGGEAAGAGAATGATGGGEAFRSVLERSAKAGRERHADEARSRASGAHAQRERRAGEVEPHERGERAGNESRADEGEPHERGERAAHQRRAGKVEPHERGAQAARERGADEVEPREGGASAARADGDEEDTNGERGARMSADVIDPAALELALAALAQGATLPARAVAMDPTAGGAIAAADVALTGQGTPDAALAASPDPSTAHTADASDASAAIDRDGALDSLIDGSTLANPASQQAGAKRASALPRSPDASPAPPLASAPRDAGATPTTPPTLSATASTTTLPPGAATLSPATATAASLAAAASLTAAATSAASLPARSSLKPPAPSAAAALSSLTGSAPAPTAVAGADAHSAQPRAIPEAAASPTAIHSRSTLDAGPLSASSSSDLSPSPSPDPEKLRSQPDAASEPQPSTPSTDADVVTTTSSAAATSAATATTPGAVAAATASPSAPAPRAISAALGDEAPHDQLRAELRQRDVTAGVSRMALRHETRAEAHIPDFGHIAVATRPRGAEVDVRVSARDPVAERALQEASRALESHLRTGAIPLGQLAIGDGGAGSSHGAPGERQKAPPSPADSTAASPHKAAQTPFDPGSMRRVRIVL